MRAIPIFMYHHINWYREDLVTLTPVDFENHLQVLRARGIRTLFLDELVAGLRREKELVHPAVALTFDDGHLDNWVYAFPLLKKYQMKATIFAVTSWMGDGEIRKYWNGEGPAGEELPEIPRHREVNRRAAEGDHSVAISWPEAEAMEKSGLVDIQSHTHLHQDYFLGGGDSFRIDPGKKEVLLEDLARSKKLIEERLQKKCRFLSWPWGKYDEESNALAKKLGYEGMLTTEKGVNYPGSEEMAMKRIVAKSGEKGWFSMRIRIYSHRSLGHIYSRLHGKI
ncbi:MAG: polysaccharide deacetylase family protein [Deltaproteobacteria bacterium]|nr:polysaccharide deacetylase family protein [Deltaproteobacteria bacterium]